MRPINTTGQKRVELRGEIRFNSLQHTRQASGLLPSSNVAGFLLRSIKMNHQVNAISGCTSLRAPQRESLEILDRILGAMPDEFLAAQPGRPLSGVLSVPFVASVRANPEITTRSTSAYDPLTTRSTPARYPRGIRVLPARRPRGNYPVWRHSRAEGLKCNLATTPGNPLRASHDLARTAFFPA